MAYHTHITPAIVLGGSDSGEANQMLHLFTEELGLVRAFARTTRVERSKLRPLIQDFTVGTASLVRGKEYWRLINMTDTHSLYYELRERREALQVFVRLASLLRRLVHGEEKHVALFTLLRATAKELSAPSMREHDLPVVEALAAGRILTELGYLPAAPFGMLLAEHHYTQPLIDEAHMRHRDIVRAVNTALRASGL